MTIEPFSKREQNKEKIRIALIKEATLLFSTKGLENTTVADIVAACNLGRGTFYNYYSDVRDIFNDVVNKVNEQIRLVTKTARATVINNPQGTLNETLLATFKAYFDLVSSPDLRGFHQKNQAFIRSASYKSKTVRHIVKDLLSDLQKSNSKLKFTDEQSKLLLTYVLIASPAELYLNNISVSDTFDTEQVAKFLADLFTSGIVKNS